MQTHLVGKELFYLYNITLCKKFSWDLRIPRKIIGLSNICGIIGQCLGTNYIVLSEEIPEKTKLFLTDYDNRSLYLTLDEMKQEFHCTISKNFSELITQKDGIIGDYEKLLPSLRSLLERIRDYENKIHEYFYEELLWRKF